jgi:predicted nucleic acid-binding protein
MIAIIDTCTILNLLQINYDDKYINLLEKIFDEVKIVPTVYEEICANKYENVNDIKNKEALNSIIYKQVKKFIDHDNIEKEKSFTKKANHSKYKDNGESHSVSYAIAKSRLGNNDLMENLLQTHFISDDSPAKKDFEYFYQINVVGQILDSIDLMTIFCLKGLVGKNEVLQYCILLKQLYNKDISTLLSELKLYSNSHSDSINSKEKMVLTQLIEELSTISDNIIENLHKIKENPNFKSIIKKKSGWDKLLANILDSNFREKIPNINRRMDDFSKVWEMNYNS